MNKIEEHSEDCPYRITLESKSFIGFPIPSDCNCGYKFCAECLYTGNNSAKHPHKQEEIKI